MTDVDRVLTTLKPRIASDTTVASANKNWFKSADSSRQFFLDTNGMPNTLFPPVHTGVVVSNVSNENDLTSAAASQIVSGSYFEGTHTLPASFFSPYRILYWNFNDATADVTLTFPDPPVIATWLRKFVPGFFRSGACWSFTFINHNATHNVILSQPAAGTGRTPSRIGWNTNQTHVIAPKTAARITIYVEDATNGNEYFYYLMH